MRIGVISDTHGLLRPEALTALAGVDHIVHAGDIGGDGIIEALREIGPVTFVRGNNDDASGFDIERVTIGGTRILVTHILPRPNALGCPSAAPRGCDPCTFRNSGRFVTMERTVSALNSDRDRRGAERYLLPKPVPATFGGFPGTLVEFSLTGCRIEHMDRVTPRVILPLRFAWRGTQVRLQATLNRSEMISVRGKPGYSSGLEFSEPPADAQSVIRDVVDWLRRDAAAKAPVQQQVSEAAAEPVPEAEEVDEVDEPEMLSALYLQCVLAGGMWQKLYVDKPGQPADGFTILAPANEAEADVLCRAYERAGAEQRRAMRARFEKAIAQALGK